MRLNLVASSRAHEMSDIVGVVPILCVCVIYVRSLCDFVTVARFEFESFRVDSTFTTSFIFVALTVIIVSIVLVTIFPLHSIVTLGLRTTIENIMPSRWYPYYSFDACTIPCFSGNNNSNNKKNNIFTTKKYGFVYYYYNIMVCNYRD